MIRAILKWLARVLVAAGMVAVVAAAGFVRFVRELPQPTTDQSETDAIVVLTGGGELISTGLTLLEQGKAKRLLVSGVHPGVGLAELLRIDRNAPGAPPLNPDVESRIDLGDMAGDTYGNAIETVEWMRANHYQSMRLVTADYHMPRALLEFGMAAPDLRILPNPVRPLRMTETPWWRDRQTFGLLWSEYGKYLVAEWRDIIARETEAK